MQTIKPQVNRCSGLLTCKLFLRLSSLGLMLLLGACQQTNQLPVGATLTVSPSERSIEIQEVLDENGLCLYNEAFYQDTPVLLALTDGQGTPVGDTEVSVFVDYTSNSFTGLPVLALYADHNGNGVIDGPEELVSGSDDGIYKSRTGQYDGELLVLLRINLSCGYKGQVFAYAGSVSGTMGIDVRSVNDSASSQ